MSYSIASLLLIQIILIALNAVFASAELAVLSVNESRINRLAEQGSSQKNRRNFCLQFKLLLHCPVFLAVHLQPMAFQTRLLIGLSVSA